MLEVYKNHRADHYKAARAVAAWGKNWQGWRFSFKLHASIDAGNHLTGIYLTPADVYDAQRMEELVKGNAKVVVGGQFP